MSRAHTPALNAARTSPFAPRRSPVAKPRIVVVDERREDYDALLEAAGELVEVVFCRTGDEALQVARRCPAAMWLINSRLEDMTGVELHSLLRPHLNRTPVFVVADEYNPADEIACLSAGSVHFLCKPLSGEWLAELCPALSRLAA